MQVDVVSTYAAALLPILRVVPGAPQVLRDWDGAMTENAPQPLIFSAWMQAFQSAVLAKAHIPIWACRAGVRIRALRAVARGQGHGAAAIARRC